jgi:hypothetical protein
MIKYSISWVANNGFECCDRSSLFTKKEKAAKHLKDIIKNNNHDKIASVFGNFFISTAHIAPVECWPNGVYRNSQVAA